MAGRKVEAERLGFGFICAVITTMIGYHMHHSVFFAVCDFLFWPIVWFKWLICQEITWKIIKETFSFFFA